MIGDIAASIAGEHADVQTLLKEGVDPHIYAPTAADVRRITSADLLLFNGLLLEGVMQDSLEARPNSLAVAASLDASRLLTPDNFAGHPDPHVWMDVALWSETVPAVRDRLAELLPDEAAAVAANADAITRRLARLDEYVKSVLASVPEPRRKLVTAHDAFSYFSRAYDIKVFAVQGVSTESEAGVEDVSRLVSLIVDEQIPAVFMEESVAARNLNAVIEGVRARGGEVAIGGTLYSDSTGRPGTWEATYFGMIDHNVNTIAAALGGSVPEGGFRGWEKSAETPTE